MDKPSTTVPTSSVGRKKNNSLVVDRKMTNAKSAKSNGKSETAPSSSSAASERANNHSKRNSSDRLPNTSLSNSSTSTSSSSFRAPSSSSDITVQLWLKSDVFTFGALPVPPHNRIVFDNLKKLVNYTYVKNSKDFPKLRFPTWRHVACDKLGMTPEVAWIYFETYDMLRDLAVPQINKNFDAAVFNPSSKGKPTPNGAGDAAPSPENDDVIDESRKDQVWVDVRRFALLLGIQRLHKISLRTSLTMGDEWPSSGQPPSSPRPQLTHASSTRSNSVLDAESCLSFFHTYLNDFMDLLLDPISSSPTSAGSSSAGSGSSGSSGSGGVVSSQNRPSVVSTDLSLEAVESLGFLIGVRLRDRRTGTDTLLHLHEIATIPYLHSLAGYDPSTKRFDYRLFEEWLRASLIADPFAFPAIALTGSMLPWIPVSSVMESSASIGRLSTSSRSSTRSSTRQILSNLNMGPRPREKVVHMSGIVKETVARSDDDEHLVRSSLKIHRSRDSYFYLLAPIRTALISKCKDSVIVLGCVETTVHLTSCENVTLIVCCRRLSVAASKRCRFHVLTASSPLILGSSNEDLTFAPYHTSYPELTRHLDLCDLNVGVNRWQWPYVMGAVSTQSETKSWKLLDPANFATFVIPFDKPSRDKKGGGRGGGGGGGDAGDSMLPVSLSNPQLEIPGGLPPDFKTELEAKVNKFVGLRDKLTADENPSVGKTTTTSGLANDLGGVVRGRFLDWMVSNGCHKELKALAKLEVLNNHDVES